jgi:hypothetical protein
MGAGLGQATARHLEIVDLSAGTVLGYWGFDPRSGPSGLGSKSTETSASNPTYTGTTPDYTATGNDGTYTITSDQTGISVETGALSTTTSAQLLIVTAPLVDAVGDILGTDIFGNPGENTSLPLFGWFDDALDGIEAPRQFMWALLAMAVGGILAVVTVRGTGSVGYGLIAFGLPIIFAVVNGLIQPWFLMLWTLGAVGMWLTGKWTEDAG